MAKKKEVKKVEPISMTTLISILREVQDIPEAPIIKVAPKDQDEAQLMKMVLHELNGHLATPGLSKWELRVPVKYPSEEEREECIEKVEKLTHDICNIYRAKGYTVTQDSDIVGDNPGFLITLELS